MGAQLGTTPETLGQSSLDVRVWMIFSFLAHLSFLNDSFAIIRGKLFLKKENSKEQ